ncbi:unnamed protein product [Vicia faba]|uniref:GATA-type domain-containing protein n=1 Tax=Vicia faba TaxID=3906 RepID=A0AAV0YZ65_VICFA|nr:unnamed protein product [Vicia faba]
MGEYFARRMDYDIDLNIPFARRMDYDIDLNIPLVSQDETQNISDANNEVHPATTSDVFHVLPMYFIDPILVIANHGVPRNPVPRLHRRCKKPRPADPSRFCTNLHCMARITPMWRSGPIGPRTLCNACGIYYKKHVIRGNIPAIIIHEDGSSSVFVPPTQSVESVEGGSSTS